MEQAVNIQADQSTKNATACQQAEKHKQERNKTQEQYHPIKINARDQTHAVEHTPGTNRSNPALAIAAKTSKPQYSLDQQKNACAVPAALELATPETIRRGMRQQLLQQ